MCFKGQQNRRNREPRSLTIERSRRGSKKEVSLPRTADPGPTRAAAQVLCHVLDTSSEQELRMLIWSRVARKNGGRSVKFEFQRDILWPILTLKIRLLCEIQILHGMHLSY